MINVVFALAALCLAALVHLAIIFLMPGLAEADAYRRLAPLAPRNGLELLETEGAGANALPFLDPALAIGICSYDVTERPLRLTLSTGDSPVSVSFLQEGGSVFYALTDRAAVRGSLDVLLVTAAQLTAIEAEDADDEAIQELRLVVPRPRGIALIRATVPTPSLMARTEELVAAATCESEAAEP